MPRSQQTKPALVKAQPIHKTPVSYEIKHQAPTFGQTLKQGFGFGLGNAIALSGTALSDFHANIIRRYADMVYVCLDSDSAGMRAAEKNVWPLFAAELEVLVASFPEKEDPARESCNCLPSNLAAVSL
jgi:hypothetical protein